eukprot:365713-Chlamydomonas_euryale.AAC.6
MPRRLSSCVQQALEAFMKLDCLRQQTGLDRLEGSGRFCYQAQLAYIVPKRHGRVGSCIWILVCYTNYSPAAGPLRVALNRKWAQLACVDPQRRMHIQVESAPCNSGTD